MAFLKGFLRVYSFIFETILSLMAVAMGAVTLFVGTGNVDLGWLPWSGNSLGVWLVALGLLGLLCVFFAVTGWFRAALFLFSILAFVLPAKGLFYGSYSFAGPDQAKNAAILVVAAFVAMIGAWPGMASRPRTR